VATIRESASYSVSIGASLWGLVRTRNGRREVSTSATISYRQFAPNRCACRRIRSINSGPWIPSGKPGKFSTTVVQVSRPPGSGPSSTIGARFARAAYSAAVNPAEPEPITITAECGIVPLTSRQTVHTGASPPHARGEGPGPLRMLIGAGPVRPAL